MSLECFRLSCETIGRGAMLDVDTEPPGVVGDPSLSAETIVMWETPTSCFTVPSTQSIIILDNKTATIYVYACIFLNA